jgi:hypothetical protein
LPLLTSPSAEVVTAADPMGRIADWKSLWIDFLTTWKRNKVATNSSVISAMRLIVKSPSDWPYGKWAIRKTVYR